MHWGAVFCGYSTNSYDFIFVIVDRRILSFCNTVLSRPFEGGKIVSGVTFSFLRFPDVTYFKW